MHALAHHGRAMALKDLRRRRRHDGGQGRIRILVSFGHIGPGWSKTASSGRYALGRWRCSSALISLQQADPVRIAAPLLPDLASARTGHTVALVVWGGARADHRAARGVAGGGARGHAARHGVLDRRHRHRAACSPRTCAGRPWCGRSTRPSVSRRQRPCARRRDGDARRGTTALPAWRAFEAELIEVRRHGLGRSEGARGGRRQRVVGAGVRPPRRDGAGAHRDRPVGGVRCTLDRPRLPRCCAKPRTSVSARLGHAPGDAAQRAELKHKSLRALQRSSRCSPARCAAFAWRCQHECAHPATMRPPMGGGPRQIDRAPPCSRRPMAPAHEGTSG